MSQYIYPVVKCDLDRAIEDAPAIDCSYGDMSTLLNFMFWMSPIVLDDHGCCLDANRLREELDECQFHKDDVIESIKEEYPNDDSSAKELIALFNEYIGLLKFAVEGGYGLRWT